MLCVAFSISGLPLKRLVAALLIPAAAYIWYTGKALSHARAGPHHMIPSAALPCVWRLARACVSVTFAVYNIRLLACDRHGFSGVCWSDQEASLCFPWWMQSILIWLGCLAFDSGLGPVRVGFSLRKYHMDFISRILVIGPSPYVYIYNICIYIFGSK